jgi:hypothetical protein
MKVEFLKRFSKDLDDVKTKSGNLLYVLLN